MGPWDWSLAMRPDSWHDERTKSRHFWTLSPYLPRPGRLPACMNARPASAVMPAWLEYPATPALRLPFSVNRLESQARPLSTACFWAGVISSPFTWFGLFEIARGTAAGFFAGAG